MGHEPLHGDIQPHRQEDEMIRTPEDMMRNPNQTMSTTELLHAYVAVLKLAEDHAANVAKTMERFPPEDATAVEEMYGPAGEHIDRAAASLHSALFTDGG